MTLLELLRRLHELWISVCVGNKLQSGVIGACCVSLNSPGSTLLIPTVNVTFTRAEVPASKLILVSSFSPRDVAPLPERGV